MSNVSKTFIPYGRQTISEEDISAVESVLRSPLLTQGPAVPTFEKAVAGKIDAKYGVAANSATSALHIACMALGLGKGDRLWTSPITFVASANCGRYCGAEVDFVDIDPATGLMSITALEQKLEQASKEGKLPSVVVPVHLAGSSCNMKAIGSMAKKYGFKVIEDASHAIGGRYQDEPVGNCRYSSITVFSFHPVKIITTGEGGIATTNNGELARQMEELRSHGITKDFDRFKNEARETWSYEQHNLGYNYRMTDIQAALGLSQIQRLDAIVKERNELLRNYQEQLRGEPVQLLEIPKDARSAVHLAVIRLSNSKEDYHRRIFNEMRASGIGVQLHYTPVHLQPYYRKLGFKEGDFPESEYYAKNAMSIPLYPGLQEKDQQKVIETLCNLLKK